MPPFCKSLLRTVVVSIALAAASSWAAQAADDSTAADACYKASGLPRERETANPDHSLLDDATGNYADALNAVVTACSAAPGDGAVTYRLGLALSELGRKREAAAMFATARDSGAAGGYDEWLLGVFTGDVAFAASPALPPDLAKAIVTTQAGIAKTGNPELKRDLASVLLHAPFAIRDRARALALLEEDAAAKYPPAMADLAAAIATKDAPAADVRRARDLLDAAIATGSRYAMWVRAQLLDDGEGAFPRDLPAARALYVKAANAGLVPAMVAAAGMMRVGDGGPVDVTQERHFYARAGNHGSRPSRLKLGKSLLHQDPKNPSLGMNMLEEEAKARSVDAALHLGIVLHEGRDMQIDFPTALRWLHQASDGGNAEATNIIGEMYDDGEGVPADHAKARDYYERAAAGGFSEANTSIGMQYDHARGRPRDVVEAMRWYRKGADAGARASMTNVGYAYENGRGIKQDYKEAIRWYTKAAQLDDRTAQHNLANMYLDGRGVAKDKLTGLALMQKSADNGLPMALNDLALMEMDRPHPDRHRAVELLRRAATAHVAEAYNNLGKALAFGWDGRPDYVESVYWFRQAVEHPSDLNALALSESQYELGYALITGRGVARDTNAGMALMRKTASVGNKNALAYLARRTPGRAYRRH